MQLHDGGGHVAKYRRCVNNRCPRRNPTSSAGQYATNCCSAVVDPSSESFDRPLLVAASKLEPASIVVSICFCVEIGEPDRRLKIPWCLEGGRRRREELLGFSQPQGESSRPPTSESVLPEIRPSRLSRPARRRLAGARARKFGPTLPIPFRAPSAARERLQNGRSSANPSVACLQPGGARWR